MTTHSSVLAWEIPRTEEPGALQSIGQKRVGRDLATKQQKLQKINKLRIFCLEENFTFLGHRARELILMLHLWPRICENS